MNKGGDDISIDNRLNLRRVAGSNVGNRPASLLADTILGGAQQREQARECATVDDDLGLNIIASDDISNRAQSWGLDRGRSMHEQFHETTRDPCLDNGLDLIIGTVGEIRDSPTGVDEHFVIERVNELR